MERVRVREEIGVELEHGAALSKIRYITRVGDMKGTKTLRNLYSYWDNWTIIYIVRII